MVLVPVTKKVSSQIFSFTFNFHDSLLTIHCIESILMTHRVNFYL